MGAHVRVGLAHRARFRLGHGFTHPDAGGGHLGDSLAASPLRSIVLDVSSGGYGAAYPVLSGIRPHRTLVLGPLLEKSGSTGVIPGRIARQPMVVSGIVLGGLLLVPDECPTIHQVLNSSIRPETGKATRPILKNGQAKTGCKQGKTMQLITTDTGWRLLHG